MGRATASGARGAPGWERVVVHILSRFGFRSAAPSTPPRSTRPQHPTALSSMSQTQCGSASVSSAVRAELSVLETGHKSGWLSHSTGGTSTLEKSCSALRASAVRLHVANQLQSRAPGEKLT